MPDGTASADNTMVEQEVLDLLADEAPPEPEKVQVVARLSRSGAAVGAGAAAGRAEAKTDNPPRRRQIECLTIFKMSQEMRVY